MLLEKRRNLLCRYCFLTRLDQYIHWSSKQSLSIERFSDDSVDACMWIQVNIIYIYKQNLMFKIVLKTYFVLMYYAVSF